MSRNPYTLDDVPKVKESICAFFDILGFKEKVNSAKNRDISNEKLKHFHSSLRVSANFLENKKYELVTEDGISVIKEKDAYINDYSLRIFSDCFVIGYPLKDYNRIGWQGGKEIFTIMEKLSQFQLRMSLCGYLLRGAITIGELYMDNDIVYGKSLIDAHNAESEYAIYPRIILSDSALKFVSEGIQTFYLQNMLPNEYDKSDYLLKDIDDKIFLNYLINTPFQFDFENENQIEKLKNHKTLTVACMQRHIEDEDERVYKKYCWLANYHNYYCQSNNLSKELLINIDNQIENHCLYQKYDYKEKLNY